MKLLAAVGKGIGKEDTTIIGGGSGDLTKGVDTPEQARVKLDEMQKDKAFQDALFDKRNPKHKESVALQTALFAKAYPSTPRA
jgi:hypothetical protein